MLIVGGGRQPDALVQRFVELAGGPGRARIAVVPMASGAPEESGREKAEQFREFGADAFVVLVTREEAMAAATARRLEGATGIWFNGGDQSRLTRILSGTPLLEAMHALREGGAVVGGTSAGAAIMSDSMITGNQFVEDTAGYYGDEFPVVARRRIELVAGLGFLPGVLVDQHFLARERHNRLLSAVLERPGMIGVGIDESTALEVRPDGSWIVRGASQAIIYDARAAAVTASSQATLGASGVRVHLLPPGGTFDPRTGLAVLPGATTSASEPTTATGSE